MLQGTLKTKPKPDMSSSMNIEDSPKKVSKQQFRKHLMITSFLNLKRKLTSMNDQEFSLLNNTRKYFGSKIARLTNSSKNQADYVRSYFRYFQEVHIYEAVFFGERTLWTTIKSLGNIGIRNQQIAINLASIPRMLSVCHCKVTIDSYDVLKTKWWLSMPIHIKNNIKGIKLAFSRTKHLRLLEDTHPFKYFNKMESCTIHIIGDNDRRKKQQYSHSPLPVGFIVALCRIKTLKSLELNLSEISISQEMLTALLNQIAKNEPLRWYLKVSLEPNPCCQDIPIEIEELKTILNKLDFLSLNISPRDDFNAYSYNPIPDLADIKHLTNKRRRILDIAIPVTRVKALDLKDFFYHCVSLKGIHIVFPENIDLRINNDIGEDENGETKSQQDGQYLSKPKNWARNLEDVVLRLDGCCGSASESLVSALQNQSRSNLRFLELFWCTYSFSEDRHPWEKHQINMQVSGLEQFALLEELKLTSNGDETDIRKLKPVLQRLSNLKKLHLVFVVGNKFAPWDSNFPFEDCRNLQELEIDAKFNMKEVQPWGNNFIKNYKYLRNLNVLEIYSYAQPVFLQTFCSLVRKLLDLDNLRKLILQTRTVQEIPQESEESFKLSVDVLLERLKAQVKSFILSNRKLEELYIDKLDLTLSVLIIFE